MTNAHSPGNYKFFGNTAPLVITAQLQGAVPVTAANYGQFFIAPYDCVVRQIDASWRTASSSGTLQVERLQGTEAKDAGDDLLASTISTAGAAETVNTGTLTTTTENLQLSAGDRLGLVNGGTLTSLADLCVTVILTPLT
jgi:hypothetical protein